MHKSYLIKTQSLFSFQSAKIDNRWANTFEQTVLSIKEKAGIVKREWREHLGGL